MWVDIFHSPHTSKEERIAADFNFTYERAEFRRWLKHIFELERSQETMFVRHGIAPLRINYEGITTAGADAVVARFRKLLGQKASTVPVATSQIEKIGTDRNLDFALQLRRDNPDLVMEIERFRAALPSHAWRSDD